MEFREKLQQLRKAAGLTQEELAQALYVSRTAVSKWESGRGYPSIDSLKALSAFFSVSVDQLLSGERILDIARQERENGVRTLSDRLFAAADLLALLLILLPLYPKPVDGYVCGVSLPFYEGASPAIRAVYWGIFLALIAAGTVKLLLTELKIAGGQEIVTGCSMAIGVFAVFLLALLGIKTAAALAAPGRKSEGNSRHHTG